MSDVTFPTFGHRGTELPGVRCEGRAPFFRTEIKSATTGAEARTQNRVVGYRYTLSAKVRSWENEHRRLWDFFQARGGAVDSFLFTDPYDSVVRRVRFDQDDLELKFSGGVWIGDFDLVTVVG